MRKTRSAWIDEMAAALPGKVEPPQKPLESLEKARQEKPLPMAPAIPAATPVPQPPVEPPPPMSMKDAAALMESSAKALLDSATAAQKAHAAMSKISTMEGLSIKDREVSSKAERYSSEMKKIKDGLESLAKEIGDYRTSLSKPDNPEPGTP